MNEILKQFTEMFSKEYSDLYDGRKKEDSEQVERFDEMVTNNLIFKGFVIAFCDYTKDFISSDREANAFMNVYDTMNA